MSILTTPSGVAHGLFLLGMLAVIPARTRRLSWPLLAASGLVALVFSSGMVAAALMSPLEHAYPRLKDAASRTDVRHIVVLTGWASDDPDMPLTGRYTAASAYRVLLALELHRERPDCDVIVSGDATTARLMGEGLVKLGVPRALLRLENQSANTLESAAMIKALVGTEPFFLVTSAGHLERAMGAMRRQGLQAIAAPTDHQLPKDWRRADWVPTPSSLQVADQASHEYIGLLWYRLRGAI